MGAQSVKRLKSLSESTGKQQRIFKIKHFQKFSGEKMATLKNFKKGYFRKMADERGIVAANWASYHVFLKNGTDEKKGKSEDPRT